MFTRFALLALSLFLGRGFTTCFYPNGDADSQHFPCDPDAETSVCCAVGFQCLSNGLCADYRYPDWQRVLRGGCTDKNWGTECGTVCKDVWPQGDEAVTYCGNGNYCCDGDDCCNTDTSLLALGTPSITATARSTSQASTLSTTTTPQSTTSSSSEAKHKSSNNSIAIGVGVGVAVGVVLFAALLAACLIIRRKKRLQRKTNEARGVMERDVVSETMDPFAGAGHGEQATRGQQSTGVVGNVDARATRKSWGHLRGGGRTKNKGGSTELGDGDVMELSAEKVHELPAGNMGRDPGELHGWDRNETKEESAARVLAQ